MTLKPEEIYWLIKQQIEKYNDALETESIGYVMQLGDGIAHVCGLQEAMAAELLEFSNGSLGLVWNLEKDYLGAILLGAAEGIQERSIVKRTGKLLEVPVGEALLGRVINPLGVPLDGKGTIETPYLRPVEHKAPGVVERMPVHEPIETGIKAVDALIPIGKGQRELIIGDRQTGKTSLILDTIIHQKNKGIRCIYVAIGQRASSIHHIVQLLQDTGALDYTTIVAAPSSEPCALQMLAPYTGAALGEYFMYKGEHALCFYDDLSKHAMSYRELSLLLKRPSGREAYPSDIFYLHSRLLERAAKLNDTLGGGSLTALPVIETQANDLTTYIPTNVISITDGQIYLEASLFNAGIRPAINVGSSVSRVGGKAQTAALRKVAGHLRLDLAQFVELAAFSHFRSELDDQTLSQITHGEHMRELLNQKRFAPVSMERQVMILFVAAKGVVDNIPLADLSDFEQKFYDFMDRQAREVVEQIASSHELKEETQELLLASAKQFKELWMKR